MTNETKKNFPDWEFINEFLVLKNPRGASRFHYLSILTDDIISIGVGKCLLTKRLFTGEGFAQPAGEGFELVLFVHSSTLQGSVRIVEELTFGFFNTLEGAKSSLNLLLMRWLGKSRMGSFYD